MTEASRPAGERWTSKTAPWLGVGAAPPALLLGTTIAQRYGGPVPILPIIVGLTIMALLLWFQGLIGLMPPVGENSTLNQVTPRYFDPLMQRILGAVLALSMIGWYGFNAGLGGAALNALLNLPVWLGPTLLGIPILALSLRGIKSWNVVATVATVSALLLAVLVVVKLAERTLPFTIELGSPTAMLADVAVFIGYAAVFSIRSPDFSVGLGTRKDLVILIALFCGAMVSLVFAGVGLQLGTGSVDMVGILAGPNGLAVGNLLVALAIIAPTFTTLVSGAPALQAATGLSEKWGMVLMTVIGLGLAITRFDFWLRPWLITLAAVLPPIVVVMAMESTHRRRGGNQRVVPFWTWMPGSLVAMCLTIIQQTFAPLIGLGITIILTGIWHYKTKKTGNIL